MDTIEESAAATAAQAGDEVAFARLVDRHRRELQVHCYRMVGSYEESEDLVQETFLRAWRSLGTYEGRASFRSWLYRIATNTCLTALARKPREPIPMDGVVVDGVRRSEIPWLQPYPERLLEPAAAVDEEPDAVVVAKETIELAFLAAIQHLPPRQRAALIVRDVLGWSAKETADLLDSSVPSANSALQRARSTLKDRMPARRAEWRPSSEPSPRERQLLQSYIDAHEQSDPAAFAALLAEDALLTMPPNPWWFYGRRAICDVIGSVLAPERQDYYGHVRMVPTRANHMPAAANYVLRPGDDTYRALGLDVLSFGRDGKVAEITGFSGELFAAFGLPTTLN